MPKRRVSSPANIALARALQTLGLSFRRLYEGKMPIREMMKEDVERNRLNIALHACLDCDPMQHCQQHGSRR